MWRTLYSGHVSVVDIILGHNSHWSLELTSLFQTHPITDHLRHFLQEICIHFILDNVLRFRLSFLWPLILHFLAFQVSENENFQGLPVRIYLHSLHVSQLPRYPKCMEQGDRKMYKIMEISVNILANFVCWLFHALQILANQWPPNCHVNKVTSDILCLGSFFSQHQPLYKLWS